MDLKIALLAGLLIVAVLLFLPTKPFPLPPVLRLEIAIEDATWQWTIGLQGSSELILEAGAVLPRIRTDHAATSGLVSPLSPSTELDETTENVVPRIVVEHAATASPGSLEATAAPSVIVFARILVEHAATVAPLAPVAESELLEEVAQRVTHKLVIENAETVNTRTLEPLESE